MELVELAYRYLTDKTYPNGTSENRKRAIRNKAKKFVTNDGELFYKKKQKEKVRRHTCSYRSVIAEHTKRESSCRFPLRTDSGD